MDIPWWTIPGGSATRGALKTSGRSELDSWTVPQDGTRGPSLVDQPRVEPLKREGVLHRTKMFCSLF